jgi:hypothetical protein
LDWLTTQRTRVPAPKLKCAITAIHLNPASESASRPRGVRNLNLRMSRSRIRSRRRGMSRSGTIVHGSGVEAVQRLGQSSMRLLTSARPSVESPREHRCILTLSVRSKGHTILCGPQLESPDHRLVYLAHVRSAAYKHERCLLGERSWRFGFSR